MCARATSARAPRAPKKIHQPSNDILEGAGMGAGHGAGAGAFLCIRRLAAGAGAAALA
jgi:hypothetical protein